MKFAQGKPSAWKFNPATGKMFRSTETVIFLNWTEGRRDRNTVAQLTKLLAKIPPEATVSVDSESNQLDDSITFHHQETRRESASEHEARIQQEAFEARQAAEMEKSREHSRKILEKLRVRDHETRVERVLDEVQAIEKASLMLLSELRKTNDLAAIRDLQEESQLLHDRMHVLLDELRALGQPVPEPVTTAA